MSHPKPCRLYGRTISLQPNTDPRTVVVCGHTIPRWVVTRHRSC